MHHDLEFRVVAKWDDEAKVWYVSDSNVPGLATEAETMDELLRKLQVMVPEMLELNGVIAADHEDTPFSLISQVSGVSGHC